MSSEALRPLPPITVRLAQISQRVNENYYLPYSAGLLQAYAQVHGSERFVFLPPLYRRMLREEALAAFAGVDVAGFSVYVWNIRRSLMIAKALKESNPEILIIFGGPQVPDQAEEFLRNHPFIDLVSHGAGEEVFTAVLDRFAEQGKGDWNGIDGISWLAQESFFHAPPAPRRKDLTDYPSPFLTGVFDPLLAEHSAWHTPFETNRGCPFTCTFCDWGSAVATKIGRFPAERLRAEIDWLGRNRIRTLFSADANFGILPRDLEIANEMVRVREQHGYPLSFHIQAAKNITDRVVEIQRVLTRAGLCNTAAISLQSLNQDVLRHIRRENISLDAFRRIQQACLAEGIFTYTDIILSLPGESLESFISGIEELIESGQFNKVLFHDTILLPNAELAQPESRQAFGLETVEVHVPGHTALSDDLPELMEIVVAHSGLSRAEWRRMHIFAWMTGFLFYTHKMLQLVLMALQQQLGCQWRELILEFIDGDLAAFPVLARIRAELETSVARQQAGYPHSLEYNLELTPVEGIYMTPDLSLQIELAQEGLIDVFYREAASLLARFALSRQPHFPLELLHESLVLSRSHFIRAYRAKGFPLEGLAATPERLALSYDLPAWFQRRMRGEACDLIRTEPVTIRL